MQPHHYYAIIGRLGKMTTIQAYHPEIEPRPLTIRQRQILALYSYGCSRRWIADYLGIAESTVGEHIHVILGRLGAKNTAHAVAIALRARMIE